MMENMVLQATELGISSCIVSRGYETFSNHEPQALYFFTARGKDFCRELLEDGRVQVLCYTKYKEMIRLSGKAYAVADDEQIKWRERIFEEQPYLSNVYPGDTRDIGIIFCIDRGEVEYFNEITGII